MMRNLRHIFAVLGIGSFAACASSGPVPNDSLAKSQAAIRAASEVGAGGVPDASLYLRFAQEEQEQGKNYIAQGKNDEAAGAFRRANADAELALALARESAAKTEAKTAQAALQTGGK